MEQSYVDGIYREISDLRVELEPDPTVLGAKYIQKVTALCRNYLNRVAIIRIQLSQRRRNLMVQIAGEETSLSIEKDHLLAENDTVRRQPNIRDREAVVHTMLRNQVNHIASLKRDLMDVETVDKAVKLVHDELIRASAEIKVQRSLLFSDRFSGAGYGDESPTGTTNPPPATQPPAAQIDENELDTLMRGTVPTIHETKVEEEDPDLLAALASIDYEGSESAATEAPLEAIDKKQAETEDLSEVVPSEPPSVNSGVPNLDDDLLDFLEEKPASKKAPAKKPKAPEAEKQKVADSDLDLDFSDILSNV